MASFQKLVIVLLVFLCLSVSLNVVFYARVVENEENIANLQAKVNELSSENVMLKEKLDILGENVQYHPVNASPVGQWIYMAGVVSTETGKQQGEIMQIYARFMDGTGKVFIATTPKIGIDLQASAETAFSVAREISKVGANSMDCALTVAANRTVDVVDGPSAGAAITILLSSLLQGKEIRRDLAITGTIQSDGTIGKVGGIIEKAMAAAGIGMQTFLVPQGQSSVTVYVEKVTQIGDWRIVEYVPKVVNVEEYLEEQGYTIKIIEVADIHEALQYFEV
ncbi:MAG: hypothetical protein NWE99_03300 [Candidatus Bathyarchaeota archaeon]|nr:hypothetical protein [Candidatus Bathyarchaeota archaeon]